MTDNFNEMMNLHGIIPPKKNKIGKNDIIQRKILTLHIQIFVLL